ncbi:MAG: glucosaminidase domain-containing protein [Flavobacteriaceae bacterium]
MKKLFAVYLLFALCTGCGSRKKIVTKKSEQRKEVITNKEPQKEETNNNDIETIDRATIENPVINSTSHYIEVYKDIAMKEMISYGIPASITLAQGILESGSGKGRLAIEANNHFGIKCHDWTGDKIYHDDDERQECFRKYVSAETSFKDHSEFLVNRKRYSKLFELKKSDYKNWAKELRKAGYATDRKYPEKLIGLIERYELHQYDKLVLGNDYEFIVEPEPEIVAEHTVIKGDTLYSISKKYGLSITELQKLNNLKDNTISIGQTLKIKSN